MDSEEALQIFHATAMGHIQDKEIYVYLIRSRNGSRTSGFLRYI